MKLTEEIRLLNIRKLTYLQNKMFLEGLNAMEMEEIKMLRKRI